MSWSIRKSLCLALAAGLCAALAGAAHAQANPAGQFVAVVGEVRLVGRDGTARAAERGGEIREGDTIVTGASALVQVRLADGGFLSIRADTETTLERFAFAGGDDRNASMFLTLLKGGFRSVTGLVGQLNRAGYRITTPSATIGIRGTDHEPFVVTPATAAALQLAAGTYDRVHSGQTFIQNRQGLTQFANPNQTLFVSDTSAPPRLLPGGPPPIYRVPTPVTGAPQPMQAEPGTSDRRGPQAGQQQDPAAAPGGLREGAAGGLREGLRTAPVEGVKPGVGPALGAPGGVQQIQTSPALQGPSTTTTSPGITSPQTIQTAPSAIQQTPTLQQSPTLQQAPALQQSPMLKPTAPTVPMTPMHK